MEYTFSKEDTLAIKGIACMMLLWHHLFLPQETGGMDIDYFPLNSFLSVNLAIGFKIVVSIYAFLSAYGFTKSLDKAGAGNYLDRSMIAKICLKRYLSLIQGYLFIFIGAQILCRAVDNRQLTVYGRGLEGIVAFFVEFLGLADIFKTPQINATWWYMSLAILIILIVPVCYVLYNRFGLLVIFTVILVMKALKLPETDLYIWLPTIMVGVVIAKEDYLTTLKNKLLGKHRLLCFLVLTIILCFCFVLEHYARGTTYIGIMWAIETVIIIVYLHTYLLECRVCKKILGGLGRHSANIFYTHSFIRGIYLRKWTYSFHYAFVMFVILLAESLLVSIIIEKCKEGFRYNQFCDSLKKHIIMEIGE